MVCLTLIVGATRGNYRRKLLCLHRIEIGRKLVVLDVFDARSICGCGISGHSFLQRPRTAINFNGGAMHEARKPYHLEDSCAASRGVHALSRQ